MALRGKVPAATGPVMGKAAPTLGIMIEQEGELILLPGMLRMDPEAAVKQIWSELAAMDFTTVLPLINNVP